jgi:AcrR family transcriptional regulator
LRVRTEAKREAILETAAQAFMELGYERTSMAEIAARVGGSKATLYGYFPSKEDLLMQVVAHKIGGQMEPLFAEMQQHGADDARVVLTRFGEHFISTLLTPESVALRRLVIAQTIQEDVAERFWTHGPKKMFDAIESYLIASAKAGRLDAKNPKVAAKHLIALYEAEIGWRGLFGADRNYTRQQIKQIVARAVDVFLAAYGTGM